MQGDRQRQTSTYTALAFCEKMYTADAHAAARYKRPAQMAADVQSQSHIFRAEVVSNCSQAAQVCQSVNE